MKAMKKEKVDLKGKKRYASKGASFGVIGAVIGIMAAVVAKGIQLDKEEAASKETAGITDKKED